MAGGLGGAATTGPLSRPAPARGPGGQVTARARYGGRKEGGREGGRERLSVLMVRETAWRVRGRRKGGREGGRERGL